MMETTNDHELEYLEYLKFFFEKNLVCGTYYWKEIGLWKLVRVRVREGDLALKITVKTMSAN
jgi:hypothetical protein